MQTASLKISPSLEKNVRQMLDRDGFQFSSQDHAFWHACRDDFHVIFYRSGSVVLQGSRAGQEIWADRIAGVAGERTDSGVSVLGLDESGKGDYFGPLVLAGAVVGLENEKTVRAAGVRDSKSMTGDAVNAAYGRLEGVIPFAVRVIEPQDYNRLYARHGNITRLLVDEYGKLIGKLEQEKPGLIILDQFPMTKDQKAKLRKDHPSIRIETKAEKYPAVAAASVVARYHYLRWLAEASREHGIEFPRGSGPAAAELFSRLKVEKAEFFEQVAKLHFREQDCERPALPGME